MAQSHAKTTFAAVLMLVCMENNHSQTLASHCWPCSVVDFDQILLHTQKSLGSTPEL